MMATASATQYTCNEVANEYTTNCGTCGDTITNTASGLEKPATLTEYEKFIKVKQWICQNRDRLNFAPSIMREPANPDIHVSAAWIILSEACDYSVGMFFGFEDIIQMRLLISGQQTYTYQDVDQWLSYANWTPLDL